MNPSRTAARIAARIAAIPLDLPALYALIGLAGAVALASTAAARPEFADLPGRHLVRLGMGFAFAGALALLPLRLWSVLAMPAYAMVTLLLALVPVIGVEGGGAARWLSLGAVSVQPSELMKFALPLALARTCAEDAGRHGRLRPETLAGAMGLVALPVLLTAAQPDLGTAAMLGAIGLVLVLIAGVDRRAVVAAAVAGAIALPLIYRFGLHDYQRRRVSSFLDPALDPAGAGYQLQQSKIAVGSGGMWGKGYGQGTQSQLEYVPEQHTDFVFTLVGEEFGFAGVALVLLAWTAVMARGLAIARGASTSFARLAAAGAVLGPAMQVWVNVAMVTGLVPVVGMPLPLMSHGGSGLLALMAGLGLVMAVGVDRGSAARGA